jgi:DNA-binding NarL/FixJ family response regulator
VSFVVGFFIFGGSMISTELTSREKEILKLTCEGFRPADIATKLETSASTIQSQLRFAVIKLGTATVAEAAIKAARMGLLKE